jgi:hypothetical protein
VDVEMKVRVLASTVALVSKGAPRATGWSMDDNSPHPLKAGISSRTLIHLYMKKMLFRATVACVPPLGQLFLTDLILPQFDVLLDRAFGHVPNSSHVVASRPEGPAPQLLFDRREPLQIFLLAWCDDLDL